jgi:hypothetical protein
MEATISCSYLAISVNLLKNYNLNEFAFKHVPAVIKYKKDGSIKSLYYVYEITIAVPIEPRNEDIYVYHKEFSSTAFVSPKIKHHLNWLRSNYKLRNIPNRDGQEYVESYIREIQTMHNVNFVHNNNVALSLLLPNAKTYYLSKLHNNFNLIQTRRLLSYLTCQYHSKYDDYCSIFTNLKMIYNPPIGHDTES